MHCRQHVLGCLWRVCGVCVTMCNWTSEQKNTRTSAGKRRVSLSVVQSCLRRRCSNQQRAPYQTSVQGVAMINALTISIRPSASRSQATIPTKMPIPSASGKLVELLAMVFKRRIFRSTAHPRCSGTGCCFGGWLVGSCRWSSLRQKNADGHRRESARGFGSVRSCRSLPSLLSSSVAMIVRWRKGVCSACVRFS